MIRTTERLWVNLGRVAYRCGFGVRHLRDTGGGPLTPPFWGGARYCYRKLIRGFFLGLNMARYVISRYDEDGEVWSELVLKSKWEVIDWFMMNFGDGIEIEVKR